MGVFGSTQRIHATSKKQNSIRCNPCARTSSPVLPRPGALILHLVQVLYVDFGGAGLGQRLLSELQVHDPLREPTESGRRRSGGWRKAEGG
jgi:hypothetical protein